MNRLDDALQASRADSAGRAAWKRAFPPGHKGPGCRICGCLTHRPQPWPQLSAVSFGECLRAPGCSAAAPEAPAHLPEPWWCLSGADIHPRNPGIGPQSRQWVLSPQLGGGADPESRGWAPQYHVPQGHRPKETRIPKEPGERPARSVSSESMLWEAGRGDEEALGQGRSAQRAGRAQGWEGARGDG